MTPIGPITPFIKSPPEPSVVVAPIRSGGERVVQTEEAGAVPVAQSALAEVTTKRPSTQDEVKEAARGLDETLKALNLNIRLEHSINNKTKQMVVKIVSGDSGELIRQIPTEEVVALHERLADLVGVLFRGRA